MFIIFVTFTFISVVIAISLATAANSARYPIKKSVGQIIITSFIAIPIVGGLTGNFYSHGFDVPWWAFGIASGFCTLVVGMIVLFLAYYWRKFYGKQ